jgi:hypothetical protein
MRTRSKREPGAVLVFAVLLLAAGVFVLTGIAQLAATQAVVSQDEWQALQRRNMLENSRSMARQFMLDRMFRGVVSTNVGYTNASLGGFSLLPGSTAGIADYWTTPTEDDATLNLKINPFSPMERGGFYRVVVPAKLVDEVSAARTNEIDWNFQVRTRSPVAAGYSFVQQMPAGFSIEEVRQKAGDVPYIDMRTSEKFNGYPQMPMMPVSSVTNTNSGDTNGYGGFLATPITPGGSEYDEFKGYEYRSRTPGDTNYTKLEVVLELTNDSLGTKGVELFQVPGTLDYTNVDGAVFLNRPIERVILRGTDGRVYGPNLKPLHVVADKSNTCTEILSLEGSSNDRLVYVNFDKVAYEPSGKKLTIDSTNSGSWRIGITASRWDIVFDIGDLEVVGGLRTDRGWDSQGSGEATFVPEEFPEGLDYIADRMMWLEDYKTP